MTDPDRTTPRITSDPRLQFGRPCIDGTRIPAETVAETVWAGDPVDDVADWYEVPRTAVLWCCAWWVFELRGLARQRGPRRRQWEAWTEHAYRVLGGHLDDTISDPDDYEPKAAE